MRKISANYIFPISSKPIKNGILVLDDNNRIIDIIDPKNHFKEIANLEFYGGVIVPGFVDAFTLLSYASLTADDFKQCLGNNFSHALENKLNNQDSNIESVQKSINHLEAFGTKAAADIYSNAEVAEKKLKSKVYFRDQKDISRYILPHLQEIKQNRIVLINHLVVSNMNQLEPPFQNFCIGTGSLGTHDKLSIFEELKNLQHQFPEISIWETLKWACLQPAKLLGLELEFGSLEIGKKPGLNIISGIDFQNAKLFAKSELKVLI